MEILFRFTATTARVSAALVVGIATIDTESAALAANGVAKGVALTTASGSVGSISATIELKTAQFRANSAHPMVRASFWIRGRAAVRTLLRL